VEAAGELDRHLVRFRAAGDEADAGKSLGRQADQLVGETFLRRIGQALVVNVRQFIGLRSSRGHEIAATVAEGCGHRATAHRVEIAPPVSVLNPDAVAPDDHRVAAIELEGEDVRQLADHVLR